MSKTVDSLIGHYNRMFSFPRLGTLLVENVAAGIIIALLSSLLTLNGIYAFLTLSIIIILSQLISTEVTYQIAPSKRLLDRRRSFGLTYACSVLMFPAFFIALVGLGPTRGTGSVLYASLVISASLTTYLRYFATFMYMEISRLKTILTALSQPLTILLGVHFLDEQIFGQPAPPLSGIIFAILIAELSVYILRSRVSTLLRLDGLSLSRAFFASWMGGEPEMLEKALKAESERQDLEVEVFAVKKANGGGLKTILVAPGIHSGPFRNLGSSNLPAILWGRINAELYVPTFVFHVAVSHEKDLVYSKDVAVVADEILKALRRSPSEDFHHGSMMTRTPDRMTGGLGFDRQLLVWVSLAPFLSEDLPRQLQLDTEAYVEQRGLGKASLLDTHSCLSPTRPTPEVLKSLEDQIRQVIDRLSEKKPSQLEVGVSALDVQGFSVEEIAGLKGVAAFLKVASDSMGILVFDSNNMTLELRQFLDDRLPQKLGAPVEIFTTDTHVLVGIRAKKDYSPLGEKTKKEVILSSALDALRRAKADLEPVTIAALTVTIKDMAVLGANGIEILGRAADVMVNLARRLLPVTMTGCALLTLLLFYLVS